jgi:hypothetical protein
VIGELVHPWRRDEGRQALEERERLEHDVRGVSPGPPKADRKAPVRRFEGDPSRKGARRASTILPLREKESRLFEKGGRAM